MRLLIAGWQGQVARALVEAAPSRPEIAALAVGRPALDLVDPGSVARTVNDVRPDIIINSAAYTAVDKAESEPDAAYALNAEGARVLAEAAANDAAPSSSTSRPTTCSTAAKPAPYIEDDPTGPTSVYGRSKLAGEEAVRRANPRHVIVRTAWVHSATGQNFIKTMLRLGAERPELQVVDDQIGSPTYAPHLAAALLTMAHQISSAPRPEHWGTFHAAGTGDDNVVRPRPRDFQHRGSARRTNAKVDGDHHRRISDARAPPRQLAPRLQQARAHLRRHFAGLA